MQKRKKYNLRYLPIAKADLIEIGEYIAFNLKSPDSAVKIINNIEDAIKKRSTCPTSFQKYRSNKKRKYDYYRIYVDNYTIYYIVHDDEMEIRRILYNKRDFDRLSKG